MDLALKALVERLSRRDILVVVGALCYAVILWAVSDRLTGVALMLVVVAAPIVVALIVWLCGPARSPRESAHPIAGEWPWCSTYPDLAGRVRMLNGIEVAHREASVFAEDSELSRLAEVLFAMRNEAVLACIRYQFEALPDEHIIRLIDALAEKRGHWPFKTCAVDVLILLADLRAHRPGNPALVKSISGLETFLARFVVTQ